MRKYLLSMVTFLLSFVALTTNAQTTVEFLFKTKALSDFATVSNAGVNGGGGPASFASLDGNVSVDCSDAFAKNKSNFKVYKGSDMTITAATGYKITSVTFDYVKGCFPFAEALPAGGDAATKTTAAVSATYTEPKGGAKSVKFTNVGSGKTEMTKMTVVYEEGSAEDEPEDEPEEPVGDVDIDVTYTPESFSVADFDFSHNGPFAFTNSQKVASRAFKSPYLSVTATRGTGKTDPAYYTTGDAIRLYAGNKLTVSSNRKIIRVEYTYFIKNNFLVPTAENSTATEGYDYRIFDKKDSLGVYVWTGLANEVTIANAMTKDHFRLVGVKVIYETGVKDDAATKEAKLLFDEEVLKADEYVASMSNFMGTNVFQYAPGSMDALSEEIDDIEVLIDYIHSEEGVYNHIANLRNAVRSTIPTRGSANQEFLLKHQNGMYLNLTDGVKLVKDEKDATPVAFHNILCEPEFYRSQYEIEGAWISHSMYIYNTADKYYLGYVGNNFKLSNRDLKQWYITINEDGNYQIAYTDASAATPALHAIDCDNSKNVVLTSITDVQAAATANFCWNILWYTAPEVAPEAPENTESAAEATAIANASTSAAPVAIYSANGARLQSMQKGLNIVKMSDGKVVKIMK